MRLRAGLARGPGPLCPPTAPNRGHIFRFNPRNQHDYCIAATNLLSKVPTTAEGRITARKSRMRAAVVSC